MTNINLGEMQLAQRLVTKQDDPTPGLEKVEQIMEKIESVHIESGDDDSVFFIGETLPRVVYALLRRSDYDEDIEDRVFCFLELVVIFISRTVGTGFDSLAVLLYDILAENKHAFYMSNTSRIIMEDISDDGQFSKEMYKNVDATSELVYAETGQMEMPGRGVTSRIVAMINVFGQNGGFRVIKDEIMAAQGEASLARMRTLLQIMHEIREYLITGFLQWFMEIRESVCEKVLSLSDKEFKSDYKVASEVVDFICGLHSLTMHMDSYEVVDRLKLEFALKGFRSPLLERRLAGLVEMTDIVEAVADHATGARNVVAKDGDDVVVWATPEFVCEWLKANEVLEALFVNFVHTEVLKRCGRIIIFLSSNDGIGEREARMIWEASLGKHESVQKTVVKLLCDAVPLQKSDILHLLVTLMEPLKPAEYTSQHVKLLHDLAIHLMDKGTSDDGLDFKFSGLQHMWKLCLEDVHFSPPQLHRQMVDCCVQVIDCGECKDFRATLFGMCLKNVREHKSVPQSLRVMSHLVTWVGPKRKRPEVDWSDFDCLENEGELLDIVIEDLAHYNSEIRESAMVQSPRVPDRELDSECLDGYYTRTEHIEMRLKFLTTIMELQGTRISTAQVNLLWETLTKQALTDKLHDMGCKWFEDTLSSVYTRDAVSHTVQHLFTNLLCQDVSNLSEVAFSLFRYCMKLVNWMDGGFKTVPGPDGKNKNLATKYDLMGMPVLWNIAVEAKNDAVAAEACLLLNMFHQELGEEVQDRAVEKRKEYMANCMKHMLQAAEVLKTGKDTELCSPEKRVCRCIKLLKTFLHDSETKIREVHPDIQISKHGLRLKGEPITLRIQMTSTSAGETPNVTVHANDTLHSLRMGIGMTLNLDGRLLRLFAHGGELVGDSKTVSELRLCKGDIVHALKVDVSSAVIDSDHSQGSSSTSSEAESPVHAEPVVVVSQAVSPASGFVGSQGEEMVCSQGQGCDSVQASPGLTPMARSGEAMDTGEGCKVSEDTIPHYTLSHDYFIELFHLLEGPQEVAAQVWDLLMQLPTNDTLLVKLQTLDHDWDEIIGANESIYSLWYCFEIIESLLDDGESTRSGAGPDAGVEPDVGAEPGQEGDSARNAGGGGSDGDGDGGGGGGGQSRSGDTPMTVAWRLRFLERKGLNRLLAVLMSDRFTAPDTAQGFAGLWALLKIVYSLVIDDEVASHGGLSSSFENVIQIQGFMHRLLNIIRFAANLSANDETGDAGTINAPVVGSALPESKDAVAIYAMTLLQACAVASTDALSAIYAFPDMRQWIMECILNCRRSAIRRESIKGFITMAWPQPHDVAFHLRYSVVAAEGHVLHPHCFLVKTLLPIVADVTSPCPTCDDFFDLVCTLLSHTHMLCLIFSEADRYETPDAVLEATFAGQLDRLADVLVANLRKRRDAEGQEEDVVLIMTMQVIKHILMLRPHLRTLNPAMGKDLVEFIFSECLFQNSLLSPQTSQVPTTTNAGMTRPPLCMSTNYRCVAFQLLVELSRGCPEAYQALLTRMVEMHSHRELRPGLCLYQPAQMQKAPCGFVGLRNLGATCYMNSLLQQLYHVPEFRARMLKVEVEDENKSEDLIWQLQLLFGYLQESEKQFYETRSLCQAYKDYDGLPVNTSLQMDVDEYFAQLFDKLESALKGTPQEDLLKDCFGGKMVNQIICKESVRVGDEVFDPEDRPFKSEREESFYTIQLEVKQKRTILESLDLYTEGEVLEGDNKYFCEQANQRVDAVKRMCITQLPQTLILHLKRFEFDLECMRKHKVNDCCEFPTLLNMYAYTRDGIEAREKAAREAARLGRDPAAAVALVESADDCDYKLVGVLVHTGTADSGHYYSYIKERCKGGDSDAAGGGVNGARADSDGGWHLFNDMHVEPFDHSEIGAACYGGSDLVQQEAGGTGQQRSVSKLVPRMYNAYLLVYEKKGVSSERESMESRGGRLRADIPREILQSVWTENSQFMKDKMVYDINYFSFVHKVVTMRLENQSMGDEAQKTDVFKMSVHFLMDTLIHSWDVSHVDAWATSIISMLPQDEDGLLRCEWLLTSFMLDVMVPTGAHNQTVISAHWLREGLLHCKVVEARESIVRILNHAITVITIMRPQQIGDDLERVPHCEMRFFDPQAADFSEPELLEVHVNMYKNSPLLTDFPHHRFYPGGFDPHLQPPFDYQPFPRASTVVGKFIDSMLNILPDLPMHWRHFGQFFGLLSQIAKIGLAEKTFLMSRRAVSRCIDVFLHEESPLSEAHRFRFRIGDKVTQPHWEYLVDMVTDLVCSARPIGEDELYDEDSNEEEPSPVATECAGPLDDACIEFVLNRKFLNKVLVEEVNPMAAQKLALHICWQDSKTTNMVVEVVCEIIADTNEEDFPNLFNLLSILVNMRDGLEKYRSEKVSYCFMRAVAENIQYNSMCIKCLEFLTQLCVNFGYVRECVAASIYNPVKRQDSRNWFERCLIDAHDPVKTNTEYLGRAVAFPQLHLPKEAQQTSCRSGVPDGTAVAILNYLMQQIDRHLPQMHHVQPKREGPCKFMQYFRLMCAMVQVSDTSNDGAQTPFFPIFERHTLSLINALDAMNETRQDLDFNRAELVKLIYAISMQYPPMLDELVKQSDCLVMHHITVRNAKPHTQFNKFYMPAFYKLVLICCKSSPEFLEAWMNHDNSTWATEQFCLMNTYYPEVSSVLVQLLIFCLDSHPPLPAAVVRSFRVRVLKLLRRSMQHCPEAGMNILVRALDPPFADDIAQVSSSILPAVVATFCTPLDVQNQQFYFDVMIFSVQALHRIVVQGVSVGVTSEIQQGLRAIKLRTDMIKQLFSIMNISRLATHLRLQMMELTETLVRIDKSCSAAATHEAVTAYAKCKLPQIPNPANFQQDKHVTVELWPDFRGPKIPEALQKSARFFSLVVEVANQTVEEAVASNDVQDYSTAVNLVMSIAIDALPGDPSEVMSSDALALVERLTATKGGSGDKFAEVLRAEGLVGEWVRRLLLSHQFRLREAGVTDLCVNLTREVAASQWGSQDVIEINEGLLARIQAAIDACGASEEEDSKDGQSERSKFFGLLSSILPLHVICRVPSLKSDMKGRDVGGDLPRRVLAALETIAGRKGGKNEDSQGIGNILTDYTAKMKGK